MIQTGDPTGEDCSAALTHQHVGVDTQYKHNYDTNRALTYQHVHVHVHVYCTTKINIIIVLLLFRCKGGSYFSLKFHRLCLDC